MNEHEEIRPRVAVSFKKSATKDGNEGFDIDVREGATEEEASKVMGIARRLRAEALTTLAPEAEKDDLHAQLEASLAAFEKTL